MQGSIAHAVLARCVCAVGVLLIAVTAVAQDAPARLKIAAYNVENLFDVFDNPYTEDEGTEVKPRHEIEAIARTLRAIDADVVGMVEIENEPVLRAMVREMLADRGYDYVAVVPGNDGRGINLGVVSRFPILSLTSHRFIDLTLPDDDRTWRFARDLLQVTLQVTPQQRLTLFVVHFKSRHDSPDDPMSARWRLAEQTAAARIIADLLRDDPQAWIAMVGDFNDTPETPGLVLLTQGRDGDPPLLQDTHADLPPDDRITYLREPYRSTIDYILVSPALADRLASSGVVPESELEDASDHAPIWATFSLTP